MCYSVGPDSSADNAVSSVAYIHRAKWRHRVYGQDFVGITRYNVLS